MSLTDEARASYTLIAQSLSQAGLTDQIDKLHSRVFQPSRQRRFLNFLHLSDPRPAIAREQLQILQTEAETRTAREAREREAERREAERKKRETEEMESRERQRRERENEARQRELDRREEDQRQREAEADGIARARAGAAVGSGLVSLFVNALGGN